MKAEGMIDVKETHILSALRKGDYEVLQYCLDSELTGERLQAITEGFSQLKLIPTQYRTEKVCLSIIHKDANNINHVPQKLLCEDFYVHAALANCLVLQYISKEKITYRVALAAIINSATALRYIPNKLKSRELCQYAVKEDGYVLRFVPKKLKTKELCEIAVCSDGAALAYVPKEYLSENLCTRAVKNNPIALKYVPIEFVTKELCETALCFDGALLEFVPKEFLIEELCLKAVENNPIAIKYAPKEYITEELCEKAISGDPTTLKYVPMDIRTEKMCEYCLQYSKLVTDAIPIEWFKKMGIRRVAYEKHVIRPIEKIYQSRKKQFLVVEEVLCGWEKPFYQTDFQPGKKREIRKTFTSFEEFKEYLFNDLSDANLQEYDFKASSVADCILYGTRISHDVLIAQNISSLKLFELLSDTTKDIYFANNEAIKNEVVPVESVLHLSDYHGEDEWYSKKVYYISDLHLDQKIIDQFPNGITELEIQNYIHDKVIEMVANCSNYELLLILGDVTTNFEMAKLFYMELSKVWIPERIVAVLGNHELWGHGLTEKNVDGVISEYRQMLKSLGIRLLQNSMLIDGRIVEEETLLSADIETIRKACIRSKVVMFGGIGFSGYCEDFNAKNGIYRETMDDQEEIERTQTFETIYSKIKDALGKKQIIVATHMPKRSWSKDDYCKNWIYASGHSHRNECYEGADYTLYADNQIGYRGKHFSLKHFSLSPTYDIFAYYEDGVYPIKRSEYLKFNYRLGIRLTFNRIGGAITMLKRNGLYMFVFQKIERPEELFLLAGGVIRTLNYSNIQYYFDRMPFYAEKINSLLSEYNAALKRLSRTVKSVGGSGRIHGCIVDLDYYSHLYVNPIDGTVTAYYAESIVSKWKYPTAFDLIEKHCPEILNRLLDADAKVIELFQKNCIENANVNPEFVSDTSIYKPSRIIKAFQYTTDLNVIRSWDDRLDRIPELDLNRTQKMLNSSN